ncbi:hypothetical protein [Glaciibacter superstes]|uniref:hypothetical protein n=1 Tax=Glaciibacter superstes TaxID=501023 RepID=UPI0003B4E940|nr:hypothetical protein [Glaciibacter superstes]
MTIVLLSILCLATTMLGWFVLHASYTDLSSMWWVTWIGAVVSAQMVMLLVTIALFEQLGFGSGIGSIVFTAGCLIVSIVPRKWQPQWLLNLTVNGMAAASAFKQLQAHQQPATKVRADLIKEIQAEQQAAEMARTDTLSERESARVTPLARLFRFFAICEESPTS